MAMSRYPMRAKHTTASKDASSLRFISDAKRHCGRPSQMLTPSPCTFGYIYLMRAAWCTFFVFLPITAILLEW